MRMRKKRYEALYLGPGMCDGYWDNKTEQYLDDDTIINLLNKEDYDSIWEEKCIKLNKRIEHLERELRGYKYGWKKEKKGQKVSNKGVYRF